MGGIVEAYIANYDDVTAKTVTDGQVSAVTMATGKHFLRYTFRKGTGSMTSTLNVDAANGVNYVSTDLVLLFTRMETTKRIEMAALAVNELAVIVKDANGKYWYLGYDEPVAASAGDGQTGTARGDGNRYSITLQDTSASFPYEVDPTIIDGLLGE
jgi:hypothetical protein